MFDARQILDSAGIFETRRSGGTGQRRPDARECCSGAQSRHGLHFDPAHDGFARPYPANVRLRRKSRSRRIGALRDANSGAGDGENPNSILIDVGDVYQGTDVSLRNKGALMIDLLNHLKYDAWVVGNHEFDWGMERFTTLCNNQTCQFLPRTC